jgi:hypothetical protein
MSKNINTNTNIAQIILSKDHEIRLKKKPKKKSNNKKKKALEEVKTALQQFDMAVNSAKSANVKIPENLGKLPSNINQINSVKELQALALDLNNRVAQINALIQQGGSQSRTQGLFREVNQQMNAGFFPIGRPQPIQPQIIPNQPIPQPQPVQPQQTNNDDALNKNLDKLQQEILDKLNPEDRAKAEEEFEKEKLTEEEQEDQQPTGEPPELETDLGFDIGGGKRIDLKSPKGWTTIYGDYRKYVEKLTAKLIKIDDGVFEITPLELSQLNENRNDILEEHDNLLKRLTPEQAQFLASDPNLKQLDMGMIANLTLDPISLIKEIAKAQKVEIKEITSSETSTEKKLKEKRSEAVKKLLTKIEVEISGYDLIIKTANKAKSDNNKAELKQLQKEVQDDNNAITVLRDKLTGGEQVSMEAEYQDFKNKAAMLERNLVRMLNEDILLDADGNTTPLVKPKPDDAGLPKPRPKPRPDAISPENQQRINILIAYYKNVGKNWSAQEKNAYRELFNEIELAKINKKSGRPEKLRIIKRMIQQKFPSIPDSDFIETATF